MNATSLNRANSINTNENRIRKETRPTSRNRKKAIKAQQKKDRLIKTIVLILTLAIVSYLAYMNISKRKELNAKRVEYNELISDVISTELKRDRLRAKLENSVDINRIQRYAIEELGMVYANNGQDLKTDGN